MKAALEPGSTFGIRLAKGEKADDIESVRISRNSDKGPIPFVAKQTTVTGA